MSLFPSDDPLKLRLALAGANGALASAEVDIKNLRVDVSRLSAEVDRLRAERDEQVRVNGFLVGRGKEQDVIRDRLSAEVAGLREQNARVIRDAHRDAAELLTLRADVRRLEGERDGLREALLEEVAVAILAARTKYVETVPRVTCHARGRFEGIMEAAGVVRALSTVARTAATGEGTP